MVFTNNNEISVPQRMMAACSGSLLTSVVVNPFDVVRVRLQQQSAFSLSAATTLANKLQTAAAPASTATAKATAIPSGLGVSKCCKDVFWFPSMIDYCVASELEVCAVDEAKSRRFIGTWDGLKKITHHEGISTLWRGLTLTLVMSVPSNVVYFTGYEYLRDHSPIKSEILNPLVCGSFARILSATFVSPIELAKTRLQSASSNHSSLSTISRTAGKRNTLVPTTTESPIQSVYRGISSMVQQRGIFSLWKGLVLTLWRDVPFSGIYWAGVEFMRRELDHTYYFHNENTFLQSFVSGCVAGAFAALCTTPFDVGKTRQQIGHHECASSTMGMMPFMYKILKEEGISALYVGATPRVLKVAPACAIMISSYEVGKKYFNKVNNSTSIKLQA